MLDLTSQIRHTWLEELPRRLNRQLDELESIYVKSIEPHLSECYRVSWSISTAVNRLAGGLASRQTYCLDKTATQIDAVEALLNTYVAEGTYNIDFHGINGTLTSD